MNWRRPSFAQYLHEILSAVDFSGKDLERIGRTLARPYGHSEPEVASAIEIVRRTLNLSPIAAVKRARRVFRDVPVAGNAPEGRMQAKVDLLFETDKGWRLVDFKTDTVLAPEALKKHSEQLSGYAATLSAVLHRPVTFFCVPRTFRRAHRDRLTTPSSSAVLRLGFADGQVVSSYRQSTLTVDCLRP